MCRLENLITGLFILSMGLIGVAGGVGAVLVAPSPGWAVLAGTVTLLLVAVIVLIEIDIWRD